MYCTRQFLGETHNRQEVLLTPPLHSTAADSGIVAAYSCVSPPMSTGYSIVLFYNGKKSEGFGIGGGAARAPL